MKNRHFGYHIIVAYMLLAVPLGGQQLMNTDANEGRIFFNSIDKHTRIPLKKDTLYVSARSLRQEELQCRIIKGRKLISEIGFMLDYGMNEIEIPLAPIRADLQKGGVFHFYFQGKYFGKGSFELYLDPPPVMPVPIADVRVNSMDVNCDKGVVSSIEFFGNVQAGIAPYKLTWLVSKGPQVKDLINKPLKCELTTNQDISRIVVAEALDYYVTLLVEDACGNSDKKVMYVKCRENKNDDMIYFQLIDTDKKAAPISSGG